MLSTSDKLRLFRELEHVCALHPTYRGERPPAKKCADCQNKWAAKQSLSSRKAG